MSELDEFCKTLWQEKKLYFLMLQHSEFSEEFIKISKIISSRNARQIIWHVLNGIEIPKCATCNNSSKYDSTARKYLYYCSKQCRENDEFNESYKQQINEKRTQTNLSKYGCAYPLQSPNIMGNLKNTNLERYGTEQVLNAPAVRHKIQKTVKDKYGVDYVTQSPIIQQKIRKSLNTLYSDPVEVSKIRQKIISTNQKIYGVDRAFIIKGIREGKLEYREGAMHGNPYFRILRSQLEAYIIQELGVDFLNRNKKQNELNKVKKEINTITRKLNILQVRKKELEVSFEKCKGNSE